MIVNSDVNKFLIEQFSGLFLINLNRFSIFHYRKKYLIERWGMSAMTMLCELNCIMSLSSK
jgi:hypothetical protein